MGYVTYEQDGYVGIITINRPEGFERVELLRFWRIWTGVIDVDQLG